MSLDNKVCHFVDIRWHATSQDSQLFRYANMYFRCRLLAT